MFSTIHISFHLCQNISGSFSFQSPSWTQNQLKLPSLKGWKSLKPGRKNHTQLSVAFFLHEQLSSRDICGHVLIIAHLYVCPHPQQEVNKNIHNNKIQQSPSVCSVCKYLTWLFAFSVFFFSLLNVNFIRLLCLQTPTPKFHISPPRT